MKVCKPRFFDDFRCTAGACADNCCIGWEIDVDPASRRRYAQVPGPLGERLRRGLVTDADGAHFALDGRGRCALLDADNLCAVQRALGHEALCEICREHPRFTEWFGAWRETGVGLCCEEACRLLLQDPAPLTFLVSEDDAPAEEPPCEEALLSRLVSARRSLCAVLQDRALPLDARLRRVLAAARALQDELDGFAPADCPPEAERLPGEAELLPLLASLAPIDADWTRRLAARGDAAPCPDWVFEHAAVYLLFRWFLKCAYDGDALGKARLLVLFVCAARALLARGAFQSPQEALRLLSKEIEYAQENVDRLADFPL